MEQELFSFEAWDVKEYETCIMKKDFGVFKKGEKYDNITLCYENGVMETCNEKGEVIKSQKIKLSPVEER